MKNFYRLIQGDCVQVLKGFEENSIDCVVTDPPYGIDFMGKSWDKALPPREAFSEMFRVLKPGALAFVMSSPRQDVLWRMMAMLEGVGFEFRQSFIAWCYASGFPKSFDVSKGIDRKIIREEFIEEFGRKPTKEEMNRLVKEKRKIIGYQNGTTQDMRNNRYGLDNSSRNRLKVSITEPYSPLAKKWSGWKSQTGMKPAVEIVLMVNKPRSEKTIVDNVLKWGTGAMNVDETRIPFTPENSPSANRWGKNKPSKSTLHFSSSKPVLSKIENQQGRFPANLLVSDDVLTVPGKIHSSVKSSKKHEAYGDSFKFGGGISSPNNQYGDSGGFSRFFSLDSWWMERVKKLPMDIQKTFPFLIVPKASKAEREKGLEKYPLQMKKYRRPNEPESSAYGYNWNEERPDGSKRKPIKTRNIHPTVKPLKLMSYLITLGCPQGGVVLDPFLGSGTTMLAAILMNKSCVGIEISPEYAEIAKARCFKKTSLIPKECSFEIFK